MKPTVGVWMLIGDPAMQTEMEHVLEPRDQLVHLREWLTTHRELHTQHFGERDPSGHPHGWDGVVIPVWDLRQRLDEIQTSLDASKEKDSDA